MQALKVLEETSHDSRNRALGMAKGSNLALVVNSGEEVIPQESYRASWSMSYPEDLQCHYHDHMAFHAKSFWVDPSKAKEDNIKRNNKSGFTSFGPKTRSCYNCDDKRHFIAECPYENRELHNGRLIPKDKSKDTKSKYSKAPNKKFYNNKTKKGKRPSRVVLVTREEYSSDEVESSSGDEDEESSKELAAIVTTNIPSSSLFESPNENPHIKNAHCFMARSSLDTPIVLSTQEEYTSGDDDVDDEEDATSNGLVALASLSTNSHHQVNPPMRSFLWRKKVASWLNPEVSSPSPSMPNISSDLGVDDASLKVKQEMLDFDDFILNLQALPFLCYPPLLLTGGASRGGRRRSRHDRSSDEYAPNAPRKSVTSRRKNKDVRENYKAMDPVSYSAIRMKNWYEDVPRDEEIEGRRYWCMEQEFIYKDIYEPMKNLRPMQAIDVDILAENNHFEDAIWVAGRMGLLDIMKIQCDYSPRFGEAILCHFGNQER
ncbi:hypothetical protein QYE76_024260 [Lolium multiflorum]|uniref:Uncharacterized protein n=1 Tax=Lolium multiflorum TaxID=4521 RepID=A0AAD8RBR9_LOLMU|nr:hypothetical protein QYE76_024260 [Lolium multiflorum]